MYGPMPLQGTYLSKDNNSNLFDSLDCLNRSSNPVDTTTSRIQSSRPFAWIGDALDWLKLNHLQSRWNKCTFERKILSIPTFGTAFMYVTIVVFEIRINLQYGLQLTVAASRRDIPPTKPARTQWPTNRFAPFLFLTSYKSYYLTNTPSFFVCTIRQDEIRVKRILVRWGKLVKARRISAVREFKKVNRQIILFFCFTTYTLSIHSSLLRNNQEQVMLEYYHLIRFCLVM